MASTTLISLVGNDVSKADELITVFAKMVHSCLAAMHKEEEANDNISIKSEVGTPESTGDCVYPTIDVDTSSLQSGEHGTPVCTSGESLEARLESTIQKRLWKVLYKSSFHSTHF